MPIEAVHTITIKAAESRLHDVEKHLASQVDSFGMAPGCVSYSYTRRKEIPAEWIVSGCWADRESMLNHMGSTEIDEFLRSITECSTELDFRYFSS